MRCFSFSQHVSSLNFCAIIIGLDGDGYVRSRRGRRRKAAMREVGYGFRRKLLVEVEACGFILVYLI
jgi:hypothetical protein